MAQNLIDKRRLLAARMIIQAEALVDALTTLMNLQAERAALSQDFQDTDFDTVVPVLVGGTPVRIDHLTAYAAGSIFDFGLTPLSNTYHAGTPTAQSVFLQARQ